MISMSKSCNQSLTRYTIESIADGIDNNGNPRTRSARIGDRIHVDLCNFDEPEYPGASELRQHRGITAIKTPNGFKFVPGFV